MAAADANVAQDLNNAIYSLASLNPANVIATNLNDAWQAWFATVRNALGNFVPDTAYWTTFKGFWAAYAAARTASQSTNERTPPASDINPTLWRTLLSDVQSRGALYGDAARAAEKSASDLSELGQTYVRAARNGALIVGGVLAITILFSMRGGRR